MVRCGVGVTGVAVVVRVGVVVKRVVSMIGIGRICLVVMVVRSIRLVAVVVDGVTRTGDVSKWCHVCSMIR